MNPPPRAGTLLPLGSWHDPEHADLGAPAMHLLIRAARYCADHLTDGILPKRTVRELAAGTDAPDQAVSRLIEAGFVTARPDRSWQLAARVAQMNLTAAEVEARRQHNRDLAQKGGQARATAAERGADGTFLPRSQPIDPPSDEPAAGQNDQPDQPRLPSPVTRTPYSAGGTSWSGETGTPDPWRRFGTVAPRANRARRARPEPTTDRGATPSHVGGGRQLP